MSRRLDFNQDLRNRHARHGLNVKDEAEWMENDAAARWLRNNAKHASEKANHRPSSKRRASSGRKITSLKHRHADLDPCEPHAQAGVDMRRMLWI
jgi:hypothetical protein